MNFYFILIKVVLLDYVRHRFLSLPIMGYTLASRHRSGCTITMLGLHSPAPALSWVLHSGYHKAKIKVLVRVASYPAALGKKAPSELIQVTGKIQILAAIDLMSLIPSWLPAGPRFLLLGSAWIPSHKSLSIIKAATACQVPLLLQISVRSSSLTS